MFRICISLFLGGIVLGAGPCLASCGPLLISYIAGAKRTPKEGFFVWLTFSLARLSAYLILTLGVGLLSRILINSYQQQIGRYVYLFGGIFIVLIGVLMMLGRQVDFRFCSLLNRFLVEKGAKSTLVFGLIIGFLPCAPLMSILAYIALISKSWFYILIYSFSFALGTTISPLLPLTVAAGATAHFISTNAKYYRVFQAICGLTICVLGLNLTRNFFLLRGL